MGRKHGQQSYWGYKMKEQIQPKVEISANYILTMHSEFSQAISVKGNMVEFLRPDFKSKQLSFYICACPLRLLK